MKNLIIIISFFTVSFSIQAQSEGIEKVVIQSEIFCNHCSECETCDQLIFIKLKEQNKGIRGVTIDSETNTITVKYKVGKTTVDDIRKAISLAGYKADDLEADPDAYANLDGCCKKR